MKSEIITVEDFLRILVRDPQRLRNLIFLGLSAFFLLFYYMILGSGMSNRMWDNTVEHAKTCVLGGKLYIYYANGVHSAGRCLQPDLEFGSFSVICCKTNSDPKSMAILRVTFGESQKKNEGLRPDQQHSSKLLFQQLQSHFNQQQEFHVYTLLSKQQALELMDVRGGDEVRLDYLCENLGVKLIGRKGLGPSADSIIASIKAERGKRKPTSTSLTLKSEMSKLKLANSKQKFIRKAKILGNNKGSTTLNKDLGPGSTNKDLGPGSTNKDLGLKILGHGNDSSTP